jgi:asparagine synthase (glutamine-hydrolysing)
MMLSRHVRDQACKVVLTGEGADEVFAGYDIFKEAKLRRFCARQPASPRRPQLLRRLYPYLPAFKAQPQRYLQAYFSTEGINDPLFSHLPRFRTASGAKVMFSADLCRELQGYDALADLRDRLPDEFARWHPLAQAQYLEMAFLLPSYILSSQGDRMAMAHAVECRFPFLDHRVVEFGARLPARLKLRVLEEKHILRRAFASELPAAIARRPKQPYRAPDSNSFLHASTPGYVKSCLSRAEIADAGYFDPIAVDRLVAKLGRQSSAGARDDIAFVGVLSTQLWHREFVRRVEGPSSETDRVAAIG